MPCRNSSVSNYKRYSLRTHKYRVRHTFVRPFGYEAVRGRLNINIPVRVQRTEYSQDILRLRDVLCMFALFVCFLWLLYKLLLD